MTEIDEIGHSKRQHDKENNFAVRQAMGSATTYELSAHSR